MNLGFILLRLVQDAEQNLNMVCTSDEIKQCTKNVNSYKNSKQKDRDLKLKYIISGKTVHIYNESLNF